MTSEQLENFGGFKSFMWKKFTLKFKHMNPPNLRLSKKKFDLKALDVQILSKKLLLENRSLKEFNKPVYRFHAKRRPTNMTFSFSLFLLHFLPQQAF